MKIVIKKLEAFNSENAKCYCKRANTETQFCKTWIPAYPS